MADGEEDMTEEKMGAFNEKEDEAEAEAETGAEMRIEGDGGANDRENGLTT